MSVNGDDLDGQQVSWDNGDDHEYTNKNVDVIKQINELAKKTT